MCLLPNSTESNMAKKKKSVNKSLAIREYLAVSPDAKPPEVIAAMKSKGITVTAQFVSTVKSTSKKKSTRGKSPVKKSTAAKRGPRKATLKAAGAISLDSLIKAKQLVEEMGGVEEARSALTALEQLMD